VGAVMDASLGLLLERLRWPILRVRWEAARALAVLIRAGANGALDGLLEWTTSRTLESECLLGLSVIHAFELVDSCPEATVRKAVSKPSLTSDWMLRTIYDMFSRSMSFRSAILPQHVVVDEETASFFDHLNTMAVPPAFLCTFNKLESRAGFSFVDRWRKEWAWIYRSHPVEMPKPQFFVRLDRGKKCSWCLPQGETLVSAYLRTLTYAMHTGILRTNQAEYHAMAAIPMNCGLAALEPVECPGWSRNLYQRWRDSGRDLIKELWKQVGACPRRGEIPAALQLVEADEKNFIEITVDLVVGYGAFTTGKPLAKSPQYIWGNTETGSFAGNIRLHQEQLVCSLTDPMKTACQVVPKHVGRIDAAVASQVKLASLVLGRQSGKVCCQKNDVELRSNGEVISRWQHWYSEWKPTKFVKQESNVSSMKTVRRSRLWAYMEASGLSLALVAQVRVGTREHIHQEPDTDLDTFWISLGDNGVVL